MGSVNGSEGEDLGVIDFSSVDFGALVDEDETAEKEPKTSVDQEYVTTETSADSFADLFSEDGLDADTPEPDVELAANDPAPALEPLDNEPPPENSEYIPESGEADFDFNNDELEPTLEPVFETEVEANDPVDSRGRGTYDPFA